MKQSIYNSIERTVKYFKMKHNRTGLKIKQLHFIKTRKHWIIIILSGYCFQLKEWIQEENDILLNAYYSIVLTKRQERHRVHHIFLNTSYVKVTEICESHHEHYIHVDTISTQLTVKRCLIIKIYICKHFKIILSLSVLSHFYVKHTVPS